jgi:hypothetical protein
LIAAPHVHVIPDAVALDTAVQLAAVLVLEHKGFEGVAEECWFPEVESLATRMKGLALCVEDLFSSFFVTLLQ